MKAIHLRCTQAVRALGAPDVDPGRHEVLGHRVPKIDRPPRPHQIDRVRADRRRGASQAARDHELVGRQVLLARFRSNSSCLYNAYAPNWIADDGTTRTQLRPLPFQRPLTPSRCTRLRKDSVTDVWSTGLLPAEIPWTWNKILMRSSGATLVRDAPPAMPPAINVAAQFVCFGGGVATAFLVVVVVVLRELARADVGVDGGRREAAAQRLRFSAHLPARLLSDSSPFSVFAQGSDMAICAVLSY